MSSYLSYQTRFERGEGMETFTLIEENGRWLLARYLCEFRRHLK